MAWIKTDRGVLMGPLIARHPDSGAALLVTLFICWITGGRVFWKWVYRWVPSVPPAAGESDDECLPAERHLTGGRGS